MNMNDPSSATKMQKNNAARIAGIILAMATAFAIIYKLRTQSNPGDGISGNAWRQLRASGEFIEAGEEPNKTHRQLPRVSFYADPQTTTAKPVLPKWPTSDAPAIPAGQQNVKTNIMPGTTKSTKLKCPPVPFNSEYAFNRRQYEKDIFQKLPDSTSIIIGANVGDTSTDGTFTLLKDFAGKKIFVEPIPPLFEELTANIKRAGIQNSIPVNAAIGNTNGEAKMYCWDLDKIQTNGQPDWFSQICSFDRARLHNNAYDTKRAVNDSPMEDIVEVSVMQVTVRNLIDSYVKSSDEISVVQVDTEGFDYHVMKQLPFEDEKFRPCAIAWEHVLLSEDQNYELLSWISEFGYAFAREPQNIVMFRIENDAII